MFEIPVLRATERAWLLDGLHEPNAAIRRYKAPDSLMQFLKRL